MSNVVELAAPRHGLLLYIDYEPKQIQLDYEPKQIRLDWGILNNDIIRLQTMTGFDYAISKGTEYRNVFKFEHPSVKLLKEIEFGLRCQCIEIACWYERVDDVRDSNGGKCHPVVWYFLLPRANVVVRPLDYSWFTTKVEPL